MNFSQTESPRIVGEMRNILDGTASDEQKILQIWNSLAYLQGVKLSLSLEAAFGQKVLGGPFKGMQLTKDVLVAHFAPLLLGCYEKELQVSFEEIIKKSYDVILNIGCSVGYYAVGLARLMNDTKVFAFDTDGNAQEKCKEMARANGVESRVQVAGEFSGDQFINYTDQETLVLMDIEGAEKILLDPIAYPALKLMDILVEIHEFQDKALPDLMRERFSSSHDIKIIPNKPQTYDVGQLTKNDRFFDPFDSMLMTWECREGATPWAFMRRRRL